jgi:hypothetical protein
MKNEFAVVLSSVLLVLLVAYGLFFGGLTGFVGFNVNETVLSDLNLSVEISEDEALDAINSSEDVLEWMVENDYPSQLINDTLFDARRIFQQARYAEVLRNDSANVIDKQIARRELGLVDWGTINYNDVLFYTEKVAEVQERAVLLKDKIILQENELDSGLYSVDDEIRTFFDDIKSAYDDERFFEVDSLLNEFRDLLEVKRVEATMLAGVRQGAIGFLERFWVWILIVLFFVALFSVYIYKIMGVKLLRSKINRMRAEKDVLVGLIKKVQDDRFKKNILPAIIYNIRIKKYNERLNEIKGRLPVLEAGLVKIKKVKVVKESSGSKEDRKAIKKREKKVEFLEKKVVKVVRRKVKSVEKKVVKEKKKKKVKFVEKNKRKGRRKH